ncbi:MAG: TonB-dependent siderophore receptor [Deltaproteobacteria bacterium]|nr:TonB-dependent siderophore receptor [Deltaproteobacteria bacterium]
MTRTRRILGWALLTASTLEIAIAPALAQEVEEDETETVEDVINVVGDRKAYRGNFEEIEIPAADQFIDEELLVEVGALNLNDALDLSASVARQNNFGGLWNAFSVRGFAGDINLPSGFLVNGFNAGRGFGGPRDLVGIESVEVLKGPRSALYGRGEPGGTVNLVTKRPRFTKGGFIKGTVGSWNQYRLEGDYQAVLGADKDLGVRVVWFYEDAESFRETVETNRFGFFPSASWSLTDNTIATYELEYSSQEVPFDRGVIFSEEFGFSPRDTFVGEPGDGPIETEVVGHQLEFLHNLNGNWSLLAGFGFRETSLEGNASETNFGGRQTYFLDGQTISRFFRFRDFESEYTVLRAELSGEFKTGSLRHRLIVGADHDEFDNSLFILRARPGFFGPDTDPSTLDPADYLLLDVFNPVYGLFPIPTPGPNTDRNEVLTGTGFYIQDQISITDKFQIRIGARFDNFEQDLTNLRANPATTVTTSDDRVSPQFGANYRVHDGVTIYGSYGEGFRQQTGSDFQGNQFEPNLTKSTELGAKLDLGQFSNTVSGSLGVTLFEVKQSNFLVNDDRPEAVAAGFFSLPAGTAESTGLELDANLRFANDFNLWFSYAYTDAVFTNSNPDVDGFGGLIEVGDPLINTPEHQINLQVSKGLTVGSMPARLGGGVLYTDERNGWVAFDFTLPSYTTVRLFGEIEPVEGINLRLDVDNLFDETFFTNSFADVWVEPGSPRRFRVSASYSF